ncbi:MAG TPA: TylF/MycF/NovP-related O-methyltransferase [Anaerolineales bacterium]|nr:TylF/MycF/NovP-related O-methyltransferase [Anaerolineales bacterium]
MFSKIKDVWREALEVARLQDELSQLMPQKDIKDLLFKFKVISENVECPHNQSHILSFVVSMLKLPKGTDGVIMEAGCFKGGSTAKFSLVAKYLGLQLFVFDSFEGLPENEEDHNQTIDGKSIKGWFKGKEFSGTKEEVKSNIQKYGEISVCRFVEGWFEDTLPDFSEKILAAYIDVDLASSTRTCLKYIYPKMIPGGILVSQDGDFPLVIEVFDNDEFWLEEVGCEKPEIKGLRKNKILTIVKPH